jgi:hypothetical protein
MRGGTKAQIKCPNWVEAVSYSTSLYSATSFIVSSGLKKSA